MNLTEKISYIRGLCDGLSLDNSTPERKVILAMLDAISDMADTIAGLDEDVDQVFDELDAIDEDLTDVEDAVFGDDDDECDCGCHCHDDDDDDDDEDEDDDMYEFTCPACGESLLVDEDTLFNSDFACPSCGLKFDEILDSIDEDEDDEEAEDEDD